MRAFFPASKTRRCLRKRPLAAVRRWWRVAVQLARTGRSLVERGREPDELTPAVEAPIHGADPNGSFRHIAPGTHGKWGRKLTDGGVAKQMQGHLKSRRTCNAQHNGNSVGANGRRAISSCRDYRKPTTTKSDKVALLAGSRWLRKHLTLERQGCARGAKMLHHGSMKDNYGGLSRVPNMTYAFGQELHRKSVL